MTSIMIFKLQYKTISILLLSVVTHGLHITNRTLKTEQLVTLDILGSDRDFVVDIETDHDNHINEDIQIETHECPPCLCLLDNDRDNYFVGDDTHVKTTTTKVSTTLSTTSSSTTSTTPSTTTSTTTHSTTSSTTASTTSSTTSTTTTSTTTESSTTARAMTPDGEVCLSESCIMAAGKINNILEASNDFNIKELY